MVEFNLYEFCDGSQLEGTCYMEILPGRYKKKCWNKNSIYFYEENFDIYELFFASIYKNYDHCDFMYFNKKRIESVVAKLNEFLSYIQEENNILDSLKKVGVFGQIYSKYSEEMIGALPVKQLITDTEKFVGWLKNTVASYNGLTILGM